MSTKQEKIARIDVRGLPNYNFISLYMQYMGDKRTYQEYNYINAKSAITAIILGRLHAKTQSIHGAVFPRPLKVNDLNIIIGDTGTGKSVSHDRSKDITERATGDTIFLEKAAPETIAKELADCKILTDIVDPSKKRKNKKGKEETEDDEDEQITGESKTLREVSKEIELEATRYPRGWRVYWKGEFGSFLASTKKTYMSGIIEDICDYYSGNIEPKTIVGEKKGSNLKYKYSKDLFFAVNGSMTPASLEYLSIEDIQKGLVRFDFFDGSNLTPLEIPENTDISTIQQTGDIFSRADDFKKRNGTEQDELRERAIIKAGQIMDLLLTSELDKHKSIEVEFSEEATELIKNYEKTMLRHFRNNPYIKTLRSRHMENIYKHCICVEYGNVPYYVVMNQGGISENEIRISDTYKDAKNIDDVYRALETFDVGKIDYQHRLTRLIITAETAKFVLKMYDRIFFPSVISVVEKIRKQENKAKINIVEKIVKVLESSPRISKDEVAKMFAEDSVRYEQIKLIEKKKLESEGLSATQIDKEIKQYKDTNELNAKYFGELDDDYIITKITHRDLLRKTKELTEDVERAIKTLTDSKSVMRFKTGRIETYVYIPVDDFLELPADNYVNYEGTGSYQSGVIIEKIYTPHETGEDLFGEIGEIELKVKSEVTEVAESWM